MDNEIEILISAVDDASATLAEVGTSMSEMTATMQADLAEVGLAFNEATGTIENATLSQEQSFNLMAEVMQTDVAEIQELILSEGISFQEAAATVEEANAEIAASSEEAGASSTGAFAGMGAIGSIAFLGLKSLIGDAIGSAEQWNQKSATMQQILKDTGSSIPLTQLQAYAQTVQDETLFNQNDVLSAEALLMAHKDLQGNYQQLTLLSADLATKMGTDLPTATLLLTNALADPVAGMNQLIRQGNIDFPAATVAMIEKMAKVGDTAGAGAMIMKTLNGSIGGAAEAAANASGGSIVQMQNQLTALGLAIGQDLLPLLDMISKALIPVIQDVKAWAEAHPKLTDAIVIGAIALAALLAMIGLIGVAVLTVTPAIEFLGVVLGGLAALALLPAAPFILLGVLIVGLAALIITNWSNLVADFQAMGEIMQANIHTLLTNIDTDWKNMWTAIDGFFGNIWHGIINDLKTAINTVITILDDLIAGIDALHINIPAIQIPVTKVGTPAVNIGFDIPQIPHLAEGGIVSVPTVALIGEAGPEAIVPLSGAGASYGGGVGGGQPITINIQGGNYLDKQGADLIAQALVTKIQRQLKLTSFR